MSGLNLKGLSKECSKYKTTGLFKVLGEYSECPELRSLIEFEVVNVKNLQLHDINKRKARDDFFHVLINNIDDQYFVSRVKNILSVCQVSESYIDSIKTELKKLPVMFKDVSVQCWSVIENSLSEGRYLLEAISKNIKTQGEGGKVLTLNSRNIVNESGVSFSPDSALDKIVSHLTLTLKMLSHEHGLSSRGEIIIPERVNNEGLDITGAQGVFYYSLLWGELIKCAESCILFENEMKIRTVTKMGEPTDRANDKTEVVFNRTKDDFERYDTISNERLSRRINQNYWEAMVDYNIEGKIPKFVSDWSGNLQEPISTYELPCLVALMEAIACQDPEQIVLGLSLREWVRGYSVIAYLAQEVPHKNIYTKNELISTLRLGGLKDRKANDFIEYITFGDDSRDFYDSPLVKVSNDSFFIFTPAYISPLISNIIISKFSSKKVDLSKKGYGFERDIIDVLNEHKIENKSFKFKRGNNEFEYDVIFLLDDKAFVVECKNNNLSGGSVVGAYKKKLFIDETTNQVKRLVNGLNSYPEVFEEHFGKDMKNYDLIPVIMNNLPFSLPGKVNDVYVTDSSAFGRILRSRYITSGVISHQDGFKITKGKNVFDMWGSDFVSAVKIIDNLENPIQIDDFLKYKKTGRYPLIINESKIFFNVVNETDYDAMSADQSEYFMSKDID